MRNGSIASKKRVQSRQGKINTNYAAMQMQRSMSNEQSQRSNAHFINAYDHQLQQQPQNYSYNNNNNKTTKNMIMQRNALNVPHLSVVYYTSQSQSPLPQHMHFKSNTSNDRL